MQHDFILLDRSSSMQGLWKEAISSINAYVAKLAEDKVDTGVTIAAFDSEKGALDFVILRDRIVPATLKPLDPGEVYPRGMTPLNDAIGRIVAMAKGGLYDKVAMIIMTDGEENCSKELTRDAAKRLLDECRANNWQVIFLGANFDNASQAASLGNKSASTISVSPQNLAGVMRSTGALRSAYGASGVAMAYTPDQQEAAKR